MFSSFVFILFSSETVSIYIIYDNTATYNVNTILQFKYIAEYIRPSKRKFKYLITSVASFLSN